MEAIRSGTVIRLGGSHTSALGVIRTGVFGFLRTTSAMEIPNTPPKL